MKHDHNGVGRMHCSMEAICKYNDKYDNAIYMAATEPGAGTDDALLERACYLQDVAIWICGGEMPEGAIDFIWRCTPAEIRFLRLFQ
jgi:hypothetical protein